MNRWLKYGLHAAVLIGLVIAGFRYLNGAEIWDALRRFDLRYVPFIAVVSALYLALKAWRFHLLLAPFADADRWTVMRAYAAGQAATLVPGGIAARVGLLRQADVAVEDASVPVAFSSIADQAVFIACAVVAAVFFEPVRLPALVITGAIAAVGLLLLVPQVRSGLDRSARWVAGRFGVEERWQTFLDNVGRLFTTRTLVATLGLTLASVALEVVALDLVVRGAQGESVAVPTLALAYIVPTMLGRLSGLPAGLGVTEAGMVGFLSGFSALASGPATAVTLVFRVATAFFRAALGAVVYAVAWRGSDEDADRTG